MLNQICEELRNYFLKNRMSDIHLGTFTIEGGEIAPLDFLQNGQYFRIVGSVFNDGVHQYPVDGLTDETFNGAVWAMSVPPAVIALADEIKSYNESDSGKASPYTSESFGGYSYSKASDSNGVPVQWQAVFRKRLEPYRRINIL